MKLLVLDLDGILVKEPLAYRLTEKYRQEGLKYWYLYSEGKISMTELAISVAKTHKGLSYDQIEDEAEKVEKYLHLKDFAEKLKRDYLIAIVSAEYLNIVEKISKQLDIKDFFGNRIIFENGKHSGKLQEPIIAENEKAKIALNLKKSYGIDELVSIGDDNSNIELFKVSDFSIAYNATEKLKKVADIFVNSENILDLLKFLLPDR